VDARSGRLLRHFQATSSDIFTQTGIATGRDLEFGASPNLFRRPDGRLLVGEMQKSRVYWAVDAITMKRAWNQEIGTTPEVRFQDTLSSTALGVDGEAPGASAAGRAVRPVSQ
jgi:hypothetical protein